MKVETPDICVDQECAKTLTAPFYADTSALLHSATFVLMKGKVLYCLPSGVSEQKTIYNINFSGLCRQAPQFCSALCRL